MPKKKANKSPENNDEKKADPGLRVVSRSITDEMRESYLDYAMSVITARALPDVRDGLKPVHRRILFAMLENGLTATARFKKSAAVVGDVLAKYHPHGDQSVYDALVKLAQSFATRYPMVIGQGNFGCFTKDTKVRLVDGRSLSFEELVVEDNEGKSNYTFTVTDDGSIAVARIEKPRCTIRDAKLVEVTLDSGERIRCTPTHRFLLKNQTYVEAHHLAPGVSLMPLYTRLSKKGEGALPDMEGYEMVLSPLRSRWELIHHLADAYNLARGQYTVSAGRVRHHVDFNKLNNNPDNIRRMHWSAHWHLHAKLAGDRHKSDPEYVKKLAEGRKAFWAKKENRDAYRERLRERNIRNWKNEVYREKKRAFLSEASKAHYEKHPELRTILSKRATRTLTRLWRDPAYRSSMREKILKGNKNHTTNRTGKVKFDAICKKVFATGKILSEHTYEETRQDLYPYGAATTWATGLTTYYGGNTEEVRAEVVGNHTVRSVRALTEREDVYDLTISGTHNFALAAGVFVHNSIDGDSAAAYRYTEAKMSHLAGEMVKDLEKETVSWRPNYDGTKREPEVLPAAAPNILLNGTLGIAVGMATNIPPHNLGEVVDATIHLIDNPDASTEDLLEFIKGPDFPVGGIAFNQKDIAHAYANGRGPVVVRGETEITEDKKGSNIIVITSIPYRVNKSDLIVAIADLVRDKKLEGIRDIRDESTTDIRVIIELKQNAQPQAVLNYLYKHTQLEDPFHYNMVALVDGVPETLSLESILSHYIDHRKEVVKRRTEFELKRAEDREHILLGLSKALDHIDAIIKIIKAAKDVPDAHASLMKKFKFSDRQASAILEMKLSKLAGLERKKIEDELKEVQKLIQELKEILSSAKKIMGVVKKELGEIKERYTDPRRTKIVKGGVKNLSMEDIVPDEAAMLTLTQGGYIKRTNPTEYKKQKRGGVGVVDLSTKEEDFVTRFLEGSTHDNILFFTDRGKVYQTRMYEVPEGKRATKGKSIMNVLPLSGEERVTSIVSMPARPKSDAGGPAHAMQQAGKSKAETRPTESFGQATAFVLITERGVAKKVEVSQFTDVRRSGIIAVTLEKNDRLIAALPVMKGDTVMLATMRGKAIRFKESDIREMGRSARGIRGMKLSAKDAIVGADVVRNEKESEFLIVTDKGYGKRTKVSEYKVQKRGGSGIKTANVTEKTGNVIAGAVITPELDEIIVASKKGQVIRTELKQVPSLSRVTQGVRVMKLREGDRIAAFTTL